MIALKRSCADGIIKIESGEWKPQIAEIDTLGAEKAGVDKRMKVEGDAAAAAALCSSDPPAARTAEVAAATAAAVTHPQQQQNKDETRYRNWDNVATILRPGTLILSGSLSSVFGDKSVEIDVALVVDGQPLTDQGVMTRLGMSLDTCQRRVVKSGLSVSQKSGLAKFTGYLVTRYTAESGSSTGPKLTLYLKSSAVQQQEKMALKAEEEETGWITHVCGCGKQRAAGSRCIRSLAEISTPSYFIDRAFPDSSVLGKKLQVAVFKDGCEVEGLDGKGMIGFKGSQNANTKTPVVRISRATASVLAGCHVQQLKAKPPDWLQVYATSVAVDQAHDEVLPSASSPTVPSQTSAAAAAPTELPAAAPSPPPSESAIAASLVQANTAGAPGASTQPEMPAAAAATGPTTWLLFTDCVLPDYDGDNILVVGQHLTKLMDLLEAPDHDLLKLHDTISRIRDLPAATDDARVAKFQYDYSRLQVWLRRNNMEQVWKAMKQLMG